MAGKRILEDFSRKSVNVCDGNNEAESPVTDMLEKHILRDGFLKRADIIKE